MSRQYVPGTRNVGYELCVNVGTVNEPKKITLPLRYDDATRQYLVVASKEYLELPFESILPHVVKSRFVSGRLVFYAADWESLRDAIRALEVMVEDRRVRAPEPRQGVYIASRASIPARAAQWRLLRDLLGWHIVSSWIDEAGEGDTANFTELWVRIETEIKQSERLILYVEADDFPLKGALVEVGIALAAGVPVYVVAPGVVIEGRSRRPIGSWIDHPLVKLVPNMEVALKGAARREPVTTEGA